MVLSRTRSAQRATVGRVDSEIEPFRGFGGFSDPLVRRGSGELGADGPHRDESDPVPQNACSACPDEFSAPTGIAHPVAHLLVGIGNYGPDRVDAAPFLTSPHGHHRKAETRSLRFLNRVSKGPSEPRRRAQGHGGNPPLPSLPRLKPVMTCSNCHSLKLDAIALKSECNLPENRVQITLKSRCNSTIMSSRWLLRSSGRRGRNRRAA
jgi:hypothetical protein